MYITQPKMVSNYLRYVVYSLVSSKCIHVVECESAKTALVEDESVVVLLQHCERIRLN